jgi:hypothetical protein
VPRHESAAERSCINASPPDDPDTVNIEKDARSMPAAPHRKKQPQQTRPRLLALPGRRNSWQAQHLN